MGHDVARKDEMKGVIRPLRASEGAISMLLSIGTPSASTGKAGEDGKDAKEACPEVSRAEACHGMSLSTCIRGDTYRPLCPLGCRGS